MKLFRKRRVEVPARTKMGSRVRYAPDGVSSPAQYQKDLEAWDKAVREMIVVDDTVDRRSTADLKRERAQAALLAQYQREDAVSVPDVQVAGPVAVPTFFGKVWKAVKG